MSSTDWHASVNTHFFMLVFTLLWQQFARSSQPSSLMHHKVKLHLQTRSERCWDKAAYFEVFKDEKDQFRIVIQTSRVQRASARCSVLTWNAGNTGNCAEYTCKSELTTTGRGSYAGLKSINDEIGLGELAQGRNQGGQWGSTWNTDRKERRLDDWVSFFSLPFSTTFHPLRHLQQLLKMNDSYFCNSASSKDAKDWDKRELCINSNCTFESATTQRLNKWIATAQDC